MPAPKSLFGDIMLWHLTILSILAVVLAGAVLFFLLKERRWLRFLKFFILGTFAMLVDFILEYTGTSHGMWTYHQSIFFVFDLVPIELMFLFFSAGVLAAFAYTRMNEINIPVRVNTILYFAVIITFLHYTRSIYMTGSGKLLYLSIAIGLWGFYNISEKNKEGALVLALMAVVVDFVAEKIVIGGGGYSYQYGFDISIPITYALLTLGVLALLEKLDKLDKLLDHPLIKKILKVVGVKREEYKKRFKEVRDAVKERMKKGVLSPGKG